VLQWFEKIPAIFYLSAVAGGLGGLLCFLHACRTNRIRTRFIRKAVLEILGGSIVGFFLSVGAAAVGASELVRACTAFVGGVGWAIAVETIKAKINAIVLALFFGQYDHQKHDGKEK